MRDRIVFEFVNFLPVGMLVNDEPVENVRSIAGPPDCAPEGVVFVTLRDGTVRVFEGDITIRQRAQA